VKRRVRVEQEAEADLASAVEYYRGEGGEELALRFLAQLCRSAFCTPLTHLRQVLDFEGIRLADEDACR
jgi:hypothetical protein